MRFGERRFGKDQGRAREDRPGWENWVTIVGVTEPRSFWAAGRFADDITVPMMLAGEASASRNHMVDELHRPAPYGRRLAQARADLDALFDAFMVGEGQPREKRDYFSHIAVIPAMRGENGFTAQLFSTASDHHGDRRPGLAHRTRERR